MKKLYFILLFPLIAFGAESNYFIFDNAEKVKFQISYDYNVLEFSTYEKYSPKLVFNYTQKSWWNIGEYSSPFEGNNYLPKLFLTLNTGVSEGVQSSLNFGIIHESNGQAEHFSRSWDRAFISFDFAMLNYQGYVGKVRLTQFREIRAEYTNEDIIYYRGNVSGKVSLRSNFLYSSCEFNYSHDKHEIVYCETELGVKVPKLWERVYMYVNYIDGYGENILHYNTRSRHLRYGISFGV